MSELEYADPPLLVRDVFDDLAPIEAMLERCAPYTPLGGWYAPGADPDAATSAMWFQQDWVHDGQQVEGAELFLDCPAYHQAARDFYEAEIVRPHSVYVNVMAGLCEHGPAHTDNPKFHGRERANTPMWLLRTMLWSGLFADWEIAQATAIWWRSDVEEGGLAYWADGPHQPPRRHVGRMANTALIGDNHRMFHQVERVGPFDQGTRRVTPRAELAPEHAGARDWVVRDRGEIVFRAPLSDFRVSVLWKADVYRDQAEYERGRANPLSLEDVARVFDADLAARGETRRFELDLIEDPEFAAWLAGFHPEATPVGAGRTIYDAA